MRELKVQCDCGQKYKFDVEPVNNQMPFTVACPICHRDGTEKANMLLRAQAGVTAAPIPLTMAAATPPPAPAPMPASLVPAPPPASAQPVLRIGTTAHAAPPAAAGEGNVPPPPPLRMPMAPPPVEQKKKGDVNIPLGILGGIIGASVGTIIWYFVTKWTFHEYGIAAWGVGVLTGVGARVFAKGSDSLLGIIAASLTLVAILGGRFLFISNLFSGAESSVTESVESQGETAYQQQMDLGKEALNAKSDDDIKVIYKKMNYEDPSDSELADFKTKDFQKMKDVASGKISKEQFISDLKAQMEAVMPKFGFKERWAIFKVTLMADPLIFLFLALGAFSAFRIGSK